MLEKCRICYDIEDKWMSKDEWEAGIEKKAGGGGEEGEWLRGIIVVHWVNLPV